MVCVQSFIPIRGKVLTTTRLESRGARCAKTLFSFDDLLGRGNWANLDRVSDQLVNQISLPF